MISFAIVAKKIKHLGIKLMNDVKDLYTENYKALLNMIENKQWNEKIFEIFGVHRLEESTQLKQSYYTKQNTDLMHFPSKSQ